MTNAGDLQGRIPFSGKLPEEFFCVTIGGVNPGSPPPGIPPVSHTWRDGNSAGRLSSCVRLGANAPRGGVVSRDPGEERKETPPEGLHTLHRVSFSSVVRCSALRTPDTNRHLRSGRGRGGKPRRTCSGDQGRARRTIPHHT